eukprot:5134820-Amphidinium_carterae.1
MMWIERSKRELPSVLFTGMSTKSMCHVFLQEFQAICFVAKSIIHVWSEWHPVVHGRICLARSIAGNCFNSWLAGQDVAKKRFARASSRVKEQDNKSRSGPCMPTCENKHELLLSL